MKRITNTMPFKKDFTGNFGYLYPVLSRIMHPATTWRLDLGALVRSQPMLSPALGRVKIKFESYFVPLRLLDVGFESRITGGLDGTDSTLFPTITVNNGTGYAAGSLADMFCWPIGVDDITTSAYKARAYGMIYNQQLRDEQLMPAVTVSTAAGPDTTTNMTLLRAPWARDYFTKARPEPQLGSPVAIPLLGEAPVTGFGFAGSGTPGGATAVRDAAGDTPTYTNQYNASGAPTAIVFEATNGTNTSIPTLAAQLDDTPAVSVEELRESSVIQRFKERMNNYGARFDEFLGSTFGLGRQDVRLQLPEYVGGGEFVLQISEVLQTSGTPEDGTPLATLAGHGIGKGGHRRIKYTAKEHGVFMVLMSIRPDTQYSQGIPREDLYRSKFDYLNPDFANLGDQEVWAGEIFAKNDGSNYDVWGYTPRYEEMLYIPSTYHGEFHKGQPLNYWTLGRQFDDRPELNASFVTCDGTDRIFAVQDEDQFQIRVSATVKQKIMIPRDRSPRLK